MANRKMPQVVDIEMNVLGISFINKYSLEKICEETTSDMYFDEKNRLIFESVLRLHKNNTPIDVNTVKVDLEEHKCLNNAGGLDYLTDVITSVSSTANLEYYLRVIKEYAIRRALIETATDIVNSGYDNDDINATLDYAEKNIFNVVKSRQIGEFRSIAQVLRSAQENLERLSKTKTVVTGLPSGFIDLDKITTGFQAGEMIIIAARPGMGKTALALNMAVNAAKSTKKAVAVFNLEMPAEMLVNRMISAEGNIDAYKLQTGSMGDNDWKRYNEALSVLADTNIYIEDNSGINISEIRAKCRRLAQKEEGLGLVVIDYLQLLSTGNKRIESRQVEVSEISRSIKTMSLELGVPVIALAQLSRNAERRENSQPMLADLRESGSLEQDADMVMFINRKDYYEAKNDKKETVVPAELLIAKHRKGATGLINLIFELNYSLFRSYTNKIEGDN